MNVEKTTEAMSQKKEEVKQPMMGKMEQKMGKTEAKDSDLGVEKEKLSGEHKEGGVQYKKSETEQKGTFQTDLDKEVKKEEDEVKTKDNTKTELLGITVTQEDLKLKDWTCLLKIHNDKRTSENRRRNQFYQISTILPFLALFPISDNPNLANSFPTPFLQ